MIALMISASLKLMVFFIKFKKLLTSTNPAHLNKPRKIYDVFYENYLNEGLISSEVHTWSHHRKIANRAFSSKCFQNYLKFMNSSGNTLTHDLICLADNQKAIGATRDEWKEISQAMSFSIYNIILGLKKSSLLFRKTFETFKKFKLITFNCKIS